MRAAIAILARQHGTNVIAGMAMTQELRSRGDGESTTKHDDLGCSYEIPKAVASHMRR